ncbi:MAG: T9SS type A sorting domain-containing protein [Crocinitomicaceae bacterium]|nr:T9SS type A sorting domain-containing protein [Crocinitomicaceae bacterium]
MKLLISFCLMLFISIVSNAQNITITPDGSTTDIQGQVFNVNILPGQGSYLLGQFNFNNESGQEKNWILTREIISQPAEWQAYFVWGESSIIGDAYPSSTDTIFNTWPITIPVNGSGILMPQFFDPQMTTTGCATWRYHISEDGVNYLAFFDIEVCMTLGTKVLESDAFTVYPNPAQDHIVIQSESSEITKIIILNEAGKIVQKSAFIPNESIDISELHDGIYFVNIETLEGRNGSHTIIIQH